MAVAVGDVWTFALEQRLFGQQVINTFAAIITETPGGVSEATWVNNWFADVTGWFNLSGSLRQLILISQTNQVTHVRWIVQRVTPNPTQVFLMPIATDNVGTVAGDCETGNIALSITRKGLTAGRRSKGRVAIAGIATTGMGSGLFGAGTIAAGDVIGATMKGLTTRVAGDQVGMGFWSPAHDAIVKGVSKHYPALFTGVVTTNTQATVRVQRSRTIGVGS